MPLAAASLISNIQTPAIFSLLPTSSLFPCRLSPSHKLTFSWKVPPLCSSFSSQQLQSAQEAHNHDDDEEENVIGDCLVFEDGIFEDPFLEEKEESFDTIPTHKPKSRKDSRRPAAKAPEIEPQNLVPDEWQEIVAQINISKKERRKIAQELEFGQRLEKKKRVRTVNLDEYLKYRDEKLSQLKPVVLENPEKIEEDERKDGENGDFVDNRRVKPRNPRAAVYGRGLDDITEFFNSGNYQPGDVKSEGRGKLFTKEEKVLLNAKGPNLAAATSVKWLPLHSIAASGELYLLTSLLRHISDINAADQDGMTALHKAIICKKQAITNFLLRESANPFVRDEDGATLMHYAVRTASSVAIKTLLLYNVDINLQDNDGWTPLHLAVQARRTDVVRLLLIKGADKSLQNKDGLTPLQLCLYSGRDTRTYELIKLLKQLPKQRL